MRSELSADEVDAVMANIHPHSRRWCSASCGPAPGDNLEALKGFGCACTGCIHGDLSWDEFSAWHEREKNREPTPYVDPWSPAEPTKLSLQERLEAYRLEKRRSSTVSSAPESRDG